MVLTPQLYKTYKAYCPILKYGIFYSKNTCKVTSIKPNHEQCAKCKHCIYDEISMMDENAK